MQYLELDSVYKNANDANLREGFVYMVYAHNHKSFMWLVDRGFVVAKRTSAVTTKIITLCTRADLNFDRQS